MNFASEAMAARFGAVIGDLSWWWRVEISGERAAAFVSRLLTRNGAALGISAAMEALWLNDAGAVRGQGIVVRLAADRFLLLSPQEDAAWIGAAAELFAVTVADRSADGLVTVIGPSAPALLAAAGLDHLPAPLSWQRREWQGLAVSLSRLGLGFEIAFAPDDTEAVRERLRTAGRDFAALPAGRAALDILDLESGLVRPARDYAPARRDDATGPLPQALGLSALVDRAHLFNGRSAVLAADPDTARIGVLLDGEVPKPGVPLHAGGKAIGRTLGSCYSPALRQVLAVAVLTGLRPDAPLEADGVACRLVDLPFLPLPTTVRAGV